MYPLGRRLCRLTLQAGFFFPFSPGGPPLPVSFSLLFFFPLPLSGLPPTNVCGMTLAGSPSKSDRIYLLKSTPFFFFGLLITGGVSPSNEDSGRSDPNAGFFPFRLCRRPRPDGDSLALHPDFQLASLVRLKHIPPLSNNFRF